MWLRVYKEKPTYEERRGKKETKHHLIYPSNPKINSHIPHTIHKIQKWKNSSEKLTGVVFHR
jgi:hypothetical protein